MAAEVVTMPLCVTKAPAPYAECKDSRKIIKYLKAHQNTVRDKGNAQ